MDGVKKVQKARVTSAHHAATMNHQQRVQKSTTLNRRFVKRPSARTAKTAQVSTAAAAAAKTLRRGTAASAVVARKASTTNASPVITKKNTVRLRPIAASQAQGASQQRAAVAKTAHASVKASGQQADLAQIRKQAAAKYQQTQAGATAQRTRVAAQAQGAQQQAGQYQKHELAKITSARIQAQKAQPARMSAQEMKERAIQQALRKMNNMEQQEGQKSFAEAKAKQKRHFFQNKKLVAASALAVLSISVLGYLVYLNMPDISVRVAAMQAGIERSYPSFVPLNYRLDGLVKEDNGRITMNFRNNSEDKSFTLTEEKTSWDSAAVLTNYVKKNWGGEYTIAKGQGLTIYISGSNAAWVNGGVLYVIEDATGTLRSSDLHDIAVSL